MASLFCEHKKLRTSCPACKASAVPPPAPEATPYVSTDERLERQEKRAARVDRASAARAPGAAAAPAERAEEPPKLRGPGKPIMPVRKKKQGVSADEAASATAWWVKKG